MTSACRAVALFRVAFSEGSGVGWCRPKIRDGTELTEPVPPGIVKSLNRESVEQRVVVALDRFINLTF
jgi:hypothetical protein